MKGTTEWEKTTQQMIVKESWEDDSILEGEEERSKERLKIERKKEEIKSGSEIESGGAVDHTDRMMDANDKEYEPTSTDSEESAVSVKENKVSNKNK